MNNNYVIMDYEKKYEEALERAKKWRNAPNVDKIPTFANRVIEEIFPELCKSEDEKIRKSLIILLQHFCKGYRVPGLDFPVSYKEMLAWLEKQGTYTKKDVDDAYVEGMAFAKDELEKQGEQKHAKNIIETWKDMRLEVYQQASGNRHEPNCSDDSTKMFSLNDIDEIIEKMSEQNPVDKVEPKFKVGNWYQCTKDFFGKGVTFDKNTAYYCAKEGCLQDEYGCHIAIVKDLYDNFKLWTIQDAKPGDVLYSDCLRILWIFKGRDTVYCGCNLNYNDGAFCGEGYIETPTDAIPAAKEQRNILFQKMKEAGYEWDDEKKELKKIEQEELSDFEKSLKHIIEEAIDDGDTHNLKADAELLLGLMQKPSDEEMKELLRTEYEKGRADDFAQMQKEWSKEDEKVWKELIEEVKDQLDSVPSPDCRDKEDEKALKQLTRWLVWLKSLKERYTWKPSDEQMEALKQAKTDACGKPYFNALASLYVDLQ